MARKYHEVALGPYGQAMNINPYLPQPLIRPTADRATVGPVASTAPARDLLHEQREAAQRLEVPEHTRRAAAQAASEYAVFSGAGLDPRAQRALRAYDAVARRDEHEYVTRILGVDEFA